MGKLVLVLSVLILGLHAQAALQISPWENPDLSNRVWVEEVTV